MPTQQQTNSSSSTGMQFDPGSMSTYQNLTGSGGKVLSNYINNPFSNPMYTFGQQQTQKGSQMLGQQNMNVLQQMMKTSGMTGKAGAGWLGAQTAQTGRANQSMRSQGNISNIMQALQRQMGATGMGMSFSPLMTGQSSTGSQTSTTSGTGTWLPQLIGAGMGAAMMGMSGGAGGASGGPSASDVRGLPASSGFGLGNSFPGFSGIGGLGSAMPPNPFAAGMMVPQN